ncbi:hypothetical protein [Nocardia suismassiliense]|uniref:hypothetical protein n=1 Tax=Nocardia suismassiliense TaxID=2077092 RepID=UPI000D1FB2E7|nr:hypothetical protein [Nocardia suismassiliense]
MTSVHIDRRVGKLEARVADIEETHGDALYDLKREVCEVRIVQKRSFALLLEHIGIPPNRVAEITTATAAEVDAALDADC